jgi:hypothetical protein
MSSNNKLSQAAIKLTALADQHNKLLLRMEELKKKGIIPTLEQEKTWNKNIEEFNQSCKEVAEQEGICFR